MTYQLRGQTLGLGAPSPHFQAPEMESHRLLISMFERQQVMAQVSAWVLATHTGDPALAAAGIWGVDQHMKIAFSLSVTAFLIGKT